MLVRLARSLRQYPDLAERAVQTAYGEAQRHQVAVERVSLLCVFAREAAGIDPVRARSAVQQASSTAAFLPIGAPADAVAAAAAAVAQVEGAAAARPLIDRALQSIPSGAARPLVEARLAARLVNAAPARARSLARQALADVGGQAFRRSGVQAFRRSGAGNRPPEHPDARPGTRAAGGARLNVRAPAHQKYFGV